MSRSRKRVVLVTAARRRAVAHASFVFASAFFAACVRPILDTVAPTVTGTYQRNDGTPFSNARVATTPQQRDSTCSQGTARGTTDSAGAFRLDSTTMQRGFWAFVWRYYVRTLVKHAPYTYWLCVGRSDSELRRVDFAGLTDRRPHDRVTCLEWTWQGRTEPICDSFNGVPEARLVIGGRWTSGADTGIFRVVQPTVPGMDSLYIQWLARSASGPAFTVRATRVAKARFRAASVWFLRGSCMEIWGYGPGRVALGPPGEIGSPDSC